MTDVVIYSLNGFAGDMWQGPQADTGRHLSNQGLNVAYWQPVGYDSGRFPLSMGQASGLRELQTQMQRHTGAKYLVSSWSLGSIIWVDAFKRIRRGEMGWPPLSDFIGATTFGNPYREQGQWHPHAGGNGYPNHDPGGAGIGGPRNNLDHTPDTWLDFAHADDMYTNCPIDQTGDDIRVIFDFVLTQWTGLMLDLWDFVMTAKNEGAIDMGWHLLGAIVDAITFYGGGTRDHTNYDPLPSMNYLAGLARAIK